MLEKFTLCATLISLISFILGFWAYAISKFIALFDAVKIIDNQMLIIDGIIDENFRTGEIYQYDIEVGNAKTGEELTLKTQKLIRYIRIYEMDIDNNFKKGKIVAQYKYLSPPRMILLKMDIPCGIPNYILEYQRDDYIISSLIIGYNGKNGYTAENVKLKHSGKSIVYYLTH